MRSDLPKVLFPLAGRPLIEYVLDAVEGAGFARVVVVVGFGEEKVRQALAGREVAFSRQEPQLGTGHAAQCAESHLEGFPGDEVILAGDVPLIRSATLIRLLETHRARGADVTVLTAHLPDPTGYGRILRAKDGSVRAIVEEKDCTEEDRKVNEINSGIFAFRHPFLAAALPRLRTENRQGEYYLTDTVGMAFAAQRPVHAVRVDDPMEVAGVNTPEQLEEAERWREKA
jgi:UDP-N-acetylglucosamine diphosphorylase/glucosamine-1-phosphate N-acetyltransferase